MRNFIITLFFLCLSISAFAEDYYVACYYYDTVTDENSSNPSLMEPSKIYIGASSNYYWALDNKSSEKLTLHGNIKDGFFVEKIYTRNDIIKSCERAIEKGVVLWPSKKSYKLYDFKASMSNFHAYEYPIRFIKDNFKKSKIKQIIVFGDSLSDTGNLKRWTKVIPYYPYWYGRFSNGFIWPDYFTNTTQIPIFNFSYGGAKTSGSNEILINNFSDKVDAKVAKLVSGNSKLAISDYLNNYLTVNSYKSKTKTIYKPKEALYIVWIGSNDYVADFEFRKITNLLLKDKDSEKKINIIVKNTVRNIMTQIKTLYLKDAYYFLVMNIPDIGKSPAVLSAKYVKYNDEIKDKQEFSEKFSAVIQKHNIELKKSIDALNKKLQGKIKIIYFDIAKDFDSYINNKHFYVDDIFDYGYTLLNSNIPVAGKKDTFIQNSCYTGGYTKVALITSLSNESYYKSSLEHACKNSNKEVDKNTIFWDSPHPTSLSHCWLSYVIQKKLEDLELIKKTSLSMNEYKEFCLNKDFVLE
ncbi:SGNH/GDSL hydrolase family protein [Fluviispira vulneris]|uniref:SGNH/GDSL hydrolase family protein n=1 Tax=Fluviispira vulneris TaxID=2763012 RepID=UPI00164851D2|nr:SGNH/GDSL hydrolase family protein [Fluviispira vulneris]